MENNQSVKIPRKLLRIVEVVKRTGLTRQQLNRMEADGIFPHRKKLSDRCVAWLEHEIDEWMDNLPNAVYVNKKPG